VLIRSAATSVHVGSSSGSRTATLNRSGSLTVVGTGIRAGGQLTPEARAAFEQADVALYLVADPIEASLLEEIRPDARSLYDHYEAGLPRRQIYDRIAEAMLVEVRQGQAVCAAFYGHPGIFVSPSHEAVRRARAEGFAARMLPAVSAEDCLFADLGVDPGETGCQSYEATDFLLRRRQVDPTAMLILWQVSVIGERLYVREPRPERLSVLVDYLRTWYDGDHTVTVYEASPYPMTEPLIENVTLEQLRAAELGPLATLYIPPVGERADDEEMAALLGLGRS
jgi:uncharacterized protein YabN with tetrapyrrole methylase and pyrophosphatase domain